MAAIPVTESAVLRQRLSPRLMLRPLLNLRLRPIPGIRRFDLIILFNDLNVKTFLTFVI
jgi:hypothetical protein